MHRNRACDPCAARKSRCDRQFPCQRCKTLSITCVTVRRHSKSGPKGPWARKKLLARALEGRRQGPGRDTGGLSTPNDEPATVNVPSLLRQRLHTTSIIPITLIRRYLDVYQQELYPIWPVVNTDGLLLRLEDSNDAEAYSLATSLCAVTMAQLNVLPEGSSGLLVVDSSKMALESERARHAIDYQERPSISILLSSFFLHIAVANQGQINKATLLLREAITFAQLLGLDKVEHYLILCNQDAQLQLRIAWLLFITERYADHGRFSELSLLKYYDRGHTTRFELPRILQLDSALPELEIDENPAILSAFVGMCNLFRDFGVAMDSVRLGQTEEFYVAMHMRLRETLELPQHCSNLQRADFFITQQWMRVVLWKKSLFYVELKINPADEGLSLSLPDSIARRVVSCLNTFPMPIIEAHGLGMVCSILKALFTLL